MRSICNGTPATEFLPGTEHNLEGADRVLFQTPCRCFFFDGFQSPAMLFLEFSLHPRKQEKSPICANAGLYGDWGSIPTSLLVKYSVKMKVLSDDTLSL